MITKKSMKAVFDCSADEPGELSFKEGDILVDVEESGEQGWYTGKIQNTLETGLFPYNYVVELPVVQSPKRSDENPMSKFPPINAFEAAMSSGKTSISSNAMTTSPPTIGSKPKIPATTTIKAYDNTSTVGKPQLKPIGNIKSIYSSQTRSRSYSTSVLLNNIEKEPMQAEKTIRPSQLLDGKGTKSALELALSKGSPKALPYNIKSNNALSKSNTAGIALPGMSSNVKLNNNACNNDTEEEDGFQMIKPSQLRQRPSIRPIASQSTSYASSTTPSATPSTTPSWKKTFDSKGTSTFVDNKTTSSTSASACSKLNAAQSSTPLPRLPSRPVSIASQRSRNSRNSSSFNKTHSVRETLEKPSPPPILKPKPQIKNTATTTQPNLPPRPKLRSTSNPPPIQPKPAMSSIETLFSKSNKNESLSVSTTPSKFTTPPPPPRNAVTKPAVSTHKTIFAPTFSTRPSFDSWQLAENTKDQLEDVNIKPSALLKNNRARSATNPVSTRPSNWMATLKPKPVNIIKPVLYERPTSPITRPVSRSPAPLAAAVIEPAKKKTNPPPPPPSRPPKSLNSNCKNTALDSHNNGINRKQRYEILFETIHDDGYVDGETARFVWLKSKLSNENLARIWRECDPDHKGLLDKHAFVDGMSKIDELLSLKQQQVMF